MELSIYLGQLLSIVLVVIGLALLLRTNHYREAYKSWMKHDGLMLFTSMVLLVTGVALVLSHNVWVLSWEVLITIIGWGTLIKGVFVAFLPKTFKKVVDVCMLQKWLLVAGASIWVVAGLYIGYFVWLV